VNKGKEEGPELIRGSGPSSWTRLYGSRWLSGSFRN
jgi:hypothetical protein